MLLIRDARPDHTLTLEYKLVDNFKRRTERENNSDVSEAGSALKRKDITKNKSPLREKHECFV